MVSVNREATAKMAAFLRANPDVAAEIHRELEGAAGIVVPEDEPGGMMDHQDYATAQWLANALNIVDSAGMEIVIGDDGTGQRVWELWSGDELVCEVVRRDAEWTVQGPKHG